MHFGSGGGGGGGGGNAPGSSLADLNEVIVGHTSYQDRAEYEEVLEEHRNVIRSQDINRPEWRRINRQIGPDFTYGDLKSLLNEVMRTEVGAFKINAGFGVVLYHVVQQEYRYFYISNNQLLFDRAFTISNRRNMTELFEKIRRINLAQNFFYQRPNSSWVLAGVPNIQIKIYRIPGIPIGTGILELPEFLKKSRSVVGLTHRQNLKKFPYTDNLCLFRCLTLHFGADKNALETVCQDLKVRLETHTNKNFDQGVEIEDLSKVEECFNVAINVYSLQEIR